MQTQEIFLIAIVGLMLIIALGHLAHALEKLGFDKEAETLKKTRTTSVIFVLSILAIPLIPVAIYFTLNMINP